MEINKLEERYGRIKFPLYKGGFDSIPDLIHTFPGIGRHFEKSKDSCRLDIIQLIKYINYLYDPESELINEFPDDLSLRKRVAAIDAGYGTKNDKFPSEVNKIFSLEDRFAVSLILDFLKIHKNHIWRDWMMNEEELNQLYEMRAMPIKDMDMLNIQRRSTLDEQCNNKIKAIASLKTKFYAGNSDLKSKTENDIIPITPENAFLILDIDEKEYTYKQVNDVH